ncbi:PTS transporter subunit EIIB [Aeromonas sp. 25-281]
MAINYADSAKQIVELIGGDSNVISVTHCATRLRFVLKEMGRVDKEVLKRVQGLTIPSYERGVARLLRYDRHP